MAGSSNFDKDLAFRQKQLEQQALEAAALSTYRLYRTQLIERGMMALEADKVAREMALNAAQAAYQQQMGRAQAILNAPRGPADWAAYANRLRGLQQSGELPGVLGTLALPGRTATFSDGGEAPPVPLTNTQFADAATLGLSGGTPQNPEIVGPSWATDQLAAQPYQVPDAFPAYYGDPVRVYKSPSGNPAITGPYPDSMNPPGYGLWPQTQQQPGGLSVMAQNQQPQAVDQYSWMQEGWSPAADLFGSAGQQLASGDQGYTAPAYTWGSDEIGPTGGTDPNQYSRDLRAWQKAANEAQKRGLPIPQAPVYGGTYAAQQQPTSYGPGSSGYSIIPPQQPTYAQAQDTYSNRETAYGGVSALGEGSASPYNPKAAAIGDMFGLGASAQAAPSPYGGPVAADPSQRGLYGYNMSYQRFRNLSPSEKELMVGYAEEGAGGLESQSRDDFLNGMLQAAPNYAPARQATWAGLR